MSVKIPIWKINKQMEKLFKKTTLLTKATTVEEANLGLQETFNQYNL